MEIEDKVKKVVESIKSLNIDINKETTEKLADSFMPAFKMWIMQSYVQLFAWCITLLVVFFLIFLVVNNLIDNQLAIETIKYN